MSSGFWYRLYIYILKEIYEMRLRHDGLCVFVCLFYLILYVPSIIFQLNKDEFLTPDRRYAVEVTMQCIAHITCCWKGDCHCIHCWGVNAVYCIHYMLFNTMYAVEVSMQYLVYITCCWNMYMLLLCQCCILHTNTTCYWNTVCCRTVYAVYCTHYMLLKHYMLV